MQAVSRAWPAIERATVLHEVRYGALLNIVPDQLLELQEWSLLMKVPMAVVGLEGVGGGTAAVPFRGAANPFTYRVYIGVNPLAFLGAWRKDDTATIGTMLGFPECCIRFFDRYWQHDGWRDLIYPAASDLLPVTCPRYTNTLLRLLGVRPVFHLPCSMTCPASQDIGIEIADLMRRIGYTQEADWLAELLSMPMEWSSLHGVAIVTTPIFKLVYASDPLPSVKVLRLESDLYPLHGARGNTFPFTTVSPMRLVRPRHLNGFRSLEAMEAGHRFILDALPELTGGVLDLGCGDGTLLRAIHQKCQDTTVHGVESNAELAKADSRIISADLFAWRWGGDYQCVLLAMQRLLEVNRGAALALLARIRQHTSMLLLYSYDGPHPEVDQLLRAFDEVTRSNDGTHVAYLLR